jgi:hypothetical protein
MTGDINRLAQLALEKFLELLAGSGEDPEVVLAVFLEKTPHIAGEWHKTVSVLVKQHQMKKDPWAGMRGKDPDHVVPAPVTDDEAAAEVLIDHHEEPPLCQPGHHPLPQPVWDGKNPAAVLAP